VSFIDGLWQPEELLKGLAHLIGPLELHDSLDSSNRRALHLAARGAAGPGCIVLARRQLAGRGRGNRPWHSPPGGLWFSLVLRPLHLDGLNLVAALAVVRACARLGLPASLRWPNDVFVGPRKLAGVLAEGRLVGARPEFVVLGLGIDVNLQAEDFPEELRPIATSMAAELGRPLDLAEIFRIVLEELDGLYTTFQEHGLAPLLGEVSASCSTLGRRVQIWTGQASEEALAVGLAPDGALLLEGGRTCYTADHVVVL
jgi:BirA family biotin operon repressor/biotin-[acetyl-CoA-carboxylase] ligase